MVASVSHVFIKTVITALIACKIAVTQYPTPHQVQEDIANITADNTKAQLSEGKNMARNSWRRFGNISKDEQKIVPSFQNESSCLINTTWEPALEFFVSSANGISSESYYADIFYGDVWYRWKVFGMNINFICVNETVYDCNKHPLKCWKRTKFITKENSTCNGKDDHCRERFDVIAGNCYVQMFVYCKEFSPGDSAAYSSRIKHVSLDILHSTEIIENKATEKDSSKKNVIIVCSALGVFLLATFILAILYRYAKPRTEHSNEVGMECADTNDLMMKHLSDSNVSETSSLLTSDTSCILVIFYPDNEISKYFDKFVMDLEGNMACKVVTATQSVDDIATNGVSEWAYQSVRNASKIIVISSKTAFQNDLLRKQTQNTCDKHDDNLLQRTFQLQWTTLINDQKLKNNYNKVFNVRFNVTDMSDVFTDIVPGRHYVIPQNFHQLIHHMKF